MGIQNMASNSDTIYGISGKAKIHSHAGDPWLAATYATPWAAIRRMSAIRFNTGGESLRL
jgi:hypothetical protein